MIRSFSVLSVLCLAVSASAFAMPAVGDKAQFDIDLTLSNGGHYNGTVDLSLTEYNATSQQYKEEQLLAIAGQTRSQANWVDAKNLLTEGLINAVLGNCAAYGGSSQQVAVGAGTFQVCALPFDDQDSKGTNYIGQATFGIIKQDSTSKKDGTHTILSLRSYHNG